MGRPQLRPILAKDPLVLIALLITHIACIVVTHLHIVVASTQSRYYDTRYY